MTDATTLEATPLVAASPFEMRINLGRNVPETDVRSALQEGDVGFLHSFTTGSCVDGPGVRVVVWMTSCMFRCRYCHNPDTWTLSNGMPVAIGRAIDELRKYANGLTVMHGGLTISGGEPLMQKPFITKLFAAAKQLGIHTALQSNGFYGEKLSDEELRDIDLVILDMKAFTSPQHDRVTGIRDNGPVIAFCQRLAALKRPMWLRYVVVPALTDFDEEMRAMASFGASLGVVERVEVLPFHQMGRYKWQRLNIPYDLEMTEPPSRESVGHAVEIFRSAGLDCP